MFSYSLYIFCENLSVIYDELCMLLIFEWSNQTLFPAHQTAAAPRH